MDDQGSVAPKERVNIDDFKGVWVFTAFEVMALEGKTGMRFELFQRMVRIQTGFWGWSGFIECLYRKECNGIKPFGQASHPDFSGETSD